MQYRLTVSIHPMPHDDQILQSLRERLEQIPGVRSVSIHPQTEMAYVVCNGASVTADIIFAAIDQAYSKNDQVKSRSGTLVQDQV